MEKRGRFLQKLLKRSSQFAEVCSAAMLATISQQRLAVSLQKGAASLRQRHATSLQQRHVASLQHATVILTAQFQPPYGQAMLQPASALWPSLLGLPRPYHAASTSSALQQLVDATCQYRALLKVAPYKYQLRDNE